MSQDDDYVGYKKPPKHTRFKKGESGNPSGRPKESNLSLLEIFKEESCRKIKAKEGNKILSITFNQLINRRLLNKAAEGNAAAIRYVCEMNKQLEKIGGHRPPPRLVIMPPEGPRPPIPPIYGEDEQDDDDDYDYE